MNRLAALAAELVDLWADAEALPQVTAESLCAGHGRQLKAVLDQSRYIIFLCSRRAGKTAAIIFRLLLRCIARRSNCVYIALTKDQARSIIWEPALGIGWKRLIQSIYGDESLHWHNETRMVTTFPNGSVVHFTGCSDIRKIETELGTQLDEAIVDEAQSSPSSVLWPLVFRVLQNALMDRRGTLLLSGTVPDVDGGVFMDIWKNSTWSKHNWSQMENPHMPHAREELDEFLKMNPGLTIDSPVIQRERFGRFVWDKNATAYTYDADLNGYTPTLLPWGDEIMRTGVPMPATEKFPNGRMFVPSGLVMAAAPMPWVQWVSIAVDEAARRDRVAVEALGWGRDSTQIQHLFDWTSEPGAGYTQGEMYAVAAMVRKQYGTNGRGVLAMKRDAGSSPNAIDTLMRDYEIPVVLAARKGDRKMGIDRVNTALVDGRIQIMRGSAVEEDMLKARWDKSARERGAWEFDRAWHPDASESFRYALEHYFDAYKPPESPKPVLTPYEEHMKREAARIAQQQVQRRGFRHQPGRGRNGGAFGG